MEVKQDILLIFLEKQMAAQQSMYSMIWKIYTCMLNRQFLKGYTRNYFTSGGESWKISRGKLCLFFLYPLTVNSHLCIAFTAVLSTLLGCFELDTFGAPNCKEFLSNLKYNITFLLLFLLCNCLQDKQTVRCLWKTHDDSGRWRRYWRNTALGPIYCRIPQTCIWERAK